MPDSGNCPICGRTEESGHKRCQPDGHGGLIADCVQCGTYELVGPEAVLASHSWTGEIRALLSCATRQASESGQRLQITESNAAELAKSHDTWNMNDKIKKLLTCVATRSGRPGGAATFDPGSDFTLIDCQSEGEFTEHVQWIIEEHFATAKLGSPSIEVRLTLKGWRDVTCRPPYETPRPLNRDSNRLS